ncbi:TonB-dependent receptor [Haoranjiania flava]|uniref:TonB-dependent receptor n=1 Tax=Haoranjiania flava TaxID=1856322 RepID=A0AAE3LIS9_9BACT|nr:TonB-dependent receptor [Haoranjiania flava]MCU7692908.1 TonB-dependent receptor [Haoranjiania flava]
MILNRPVIVAPKKCIIFILVWLFTLPYSFSQSKNGRLSGSVYAEERIPVPDAIISISTLSLTTHTNIKGDFSFNKIAAGTYEISVNAMGYKEVKQTIYISEGKQNTIEIKLAPHAATLETITLTAEKRTTLLQKTPVSVSVLNARKVEAYRLWSMKDLSAVVPNLLVAHVGSDLPSYAIRGMYSNAVDQSVSVYVDGIIQYDADNTLRNLYNIERIEVLRGPQGTLYGRNAMAGVINIISKKPGNVTSGCAEISLGNYGTQRYSAGITTPIVKDKLFAGLSGSYNKTNGYYTNSFDNQKLDKNDQLEGSLHLRYLPFVNWAFFLNVKAQQTFNHGTFPYIRNDSIALADGYVTAQNAKGVHRRHIYSAALSAQHYGKWFDLASITGFQYTDKFVAKGLWDGDWSAYDFFEMGYGGRPKDNSGRTFTQEIRLNSANETSDKWSWTAGAFYMYHPEKETSLLIAGEDAATILDNPYAPYTLSTPSKLTSNGYALFGQATYKPTSKLNITAGLRYDRETKYMYTQTTMIKAGYPDMDLAKRIRLDGKYRALSPKFNIAYHLDNSMMVYANYSRGFRAGGLNTRSLDPDFYAYGPEFSDNFELGYKAGWLDQKLFTNLALFYTNWNDMQVTAFGNTPAETGIRNTGNAELKEIELEITTVPVKDLSIDCHFSYNHGSYTKLTKPDASSGTQINLKNNQLIMQPEYMSMLATQYSKIIAGNLKGTIRGEWSLLGKHYLNVDNTVVQKPYSLVNAKAGVSYNKIELQFWARNIFNERYLSFVYPSGAPYAMLGFPATFGAGIIAKF